MNNILNKQYENANFAIFLFITDIKTGSKKMEEFKKVFYEIKSQLSFEEHEYFDKLYKDVYISLFAEALKVITNEEKILIREIERTGDELLYKEPFKQYATLVYGDLAKEA